MPGPYMRIVIITAIVSLSPFFHNVAGALMCRELFANTMPTLNAPYEQIYGGQTLIGKDYAVYKALRDAGLDPYLKLKSLSKKQRHALENSIAADLQKPIPAVRDPHGRIFLLDGHHTVLVATLLVSSTKHLNIQVALVYDALNTKVDWNSFLNLAYEKNWFYAPTAKHILENPLHVHDLANSVERSMLGLFFISIEDKYNVPMKGKHFAPFIQFYLADLIRTQQIYKFPADLDFKTIPSLQRLLLKNKDVIDFLISQLRPEAPTELRSFLENL